MVDTAKERPKTFGFLNNIFPGVPVSWYERITGAIRNIDSDHAYIHEAKHFYCFHRKEYAASESLYMYLKTPEDLYVHYRSEKVSTSGDKVVIEVYEAPTLSETPGGTAFTPVNSHYISTEPSHMEVVIGVSVSSEGLLKYQDFIGGGTGQGQARTGADTSDKNEKVWKRDTGYLIKITNLSTSANTIQINPSWYEEEA